MYNKKCKDHLGNEFNSISDMCKYWGITRYTYDDRINRGWTIEKILTVPIKKCNKKCKDHLGNEFNSISDMCKYWGITRHTYENRINKKWTLEKILTTPLHNIFKDHLGNEFKNKTDMCKYWGITRKVYDDRMKLGWPLEKTLTTSIRNTFKDHLGNEFNSISDMCKYWGITKLMYKGRKNRGWALEKILTVPYFEPKYNNIIDPITDQSCSLDQLSKKYNISKKILRERLNYYKNLNVRLIEVSFIIPTFHININQTKYNLTVANRTERGKDVFECYIDNGDGTSTFKIMTYDMIDQYCLEQYKKLHNIA